MVTLKLHPDKPLTDEYFYELCKLNPELRLERTSTGKLIAMPPTGWETGNRNSNLTTQLGVWTKANGTGLAFDSSTGFILPNGAICSPDAAWVKKDRIEALAPNPAKFLPLAPDFVVELMSASDELEDVQAKMRQYRENGVRLGWLLNPKNKQVEIYRQEQETEIINCCIILNKKERIVCSMLSGEDVLIDFLLDLRGLLFN